MLEDDIFNFLGRKKLPNEQYTGYLGLFSYKNKKSLKSANWSLEILEKVVRISGVTVNIVKFIALNKLSKNV